MNSPSEERPLVPAELIGEPIVIDTDTQLFYAGTLVACETGWLTLEHCDVHDHQESNSTREVYIMDIARHGVRENRKRVQIRMEKVVSITLLSDVTLY